MALKPIPIPKEEQGPFRPPQWAKPATILVTVPAGAQSSTQLNTPIPVVNGVNTISTKITAPTSYVFDAVLELDHEQELVKTRHPVQTGAAITSHAYIEPARLVMQVLMSDVTPQYVSVAQTKAPYIQPWRGAPSKSVSAYQQMVSLQATRIPLTVTTRLRTYYNMLIMKISPREDSKTTTGARFRIEFEQIIVADTQLTQDSTRPNDTQYTGLGQVNVQPPQSAVNTQFSIDQSTGDPAQPQKSLQDWLAANPGGVNVPGAGGFSSVNTNALQQLPAPA